MSGCKHHALARHLHHINTEQIKERYFESTHHFSFGPHVIRLRGGYRAKSHAQLIDFGIFNPRLANPWTLDLKFSNQD